MRWVQGRCKDVVFGPCSWNPWLESFGLAAAECCGELPSGKMPEAMPRREERSLATAANPNPSKQNSELKQLAARCGLPAIPNHPFN